MLAFLLLRLDLLPPLVSPDSSPGLLENAQGQLGTATAAFESAQAAASLLDGPRGDFEARGRTLTTLEPPARTQAAGALAADARLLAQAAEAAERYRAALAEYDDALMAATRGLGPASETLRNDTWPIVEQIKLYPPPRGTNSDFHPPTSAQILDWEQTIEHVQERGLDQAVAAATELGRSSYALRTQLFGYDAAYRAALERYAATLQAQLGAPAAPSELQEIVAVLATVLLTALLGLAIALLSTTQVVEPLIGQVHATRLPKPPVFAALLGAVALYYLAPWLPLAILGAILILLVFVRWPVTALAAIPAAIPFYYRPRQLGPLSFNLSETLIVLAITAALIHLMMRIKPFRYGRKGGLQIPSTTIEVAPSLTPNGKGARGRFVPFSMLYASFKDPLSWLPIVLLVGALFAFSSPLMVDSHIALRELRRTVVEPLLFLLLLVRADRRERPLALCSFMVVVAFVAADALVRLIMGTGVWAMEGVPRLIGLLPSSTALGILLGAALAAALGRLFAAPSREQRTGTLLLSVPLALATALTFTRGAWLGVAVALLVILALRRSWRTLGLALGAGALALVGLSQLSAERFQTMLSLSQGTGAARREIWASALNILEETPLVGIGPDQFSYQDVQRYAIPQIRFLQISHPHNLVLDLWLQFGLIGLVAVVAALLIALLRLAGGGDRHQGWSLAAIALLVDLIVHGMLDQALLGADMLLIVWGCVALARRDPVDTTPLLR